MKIRPFTVAAFLITNSCGIPSSWAAPPDEGSKQWERMVAHGDFISTMHDKNGSNCCASSDGRMGDGDQELKEIQQTDKDGNVHYFVFVERKIFGEDSHAPHSGTPIDHSYDDVIPPEGKIIEIDPDHVLTVDNKDVRKCLNKNNDTCTAPENNVLWLSTSGGVYCYWPQQRWIQNGIKRFARLQP